MYACVLLLMLGAAVTVLFLCEESEAACGVVSAMLAGCLLGTLISADILPMEFPVPTEGERLPRRIRRLLFLLLYVLATALFYPFVSRCLYPLRNSLPEAFEHRYGNKR